MKYVDDGKISLTPAVDLSYLIEQQQFDLLSAIEYCDCTPSLSQAVEMKKYAQENGKSYPIRKEAIIDEDTFKRVQKLPDHLRYRGNHFKRRPICLKKQDTVQPFWATPYPTYRLSSGTKP